MLKAKAARFARRPCRNNDIVVKDISLQLASGTSGISWQKYGAHNIRAQRERCEPSNISLRVQRAACQKIELIEERLSHVLESKRDAKTMQTYCSRLSCSNGPAICSMVISNPRTLQLEGLSIAAIAFL